MNKKEIKKLLHSMRNSDNDKQITVLLGKIDVIDDEKLQEMVSKIGDSQDTIKSYLQEKIETMQRRNTEEYSEHTPINELFTFGTAGNSVHLQVRMFSI